MLRKAFTDRFTGAEFGADHLMATVCGHYRGGSRSASRQHQPWRANPLTRPGCIPYGRTVGPERMRIAAVLGARQGSGYLLTPRLVLTAGHVVKNRGSGPSAV
ncbi:hypothetical protein GCM10010211_10470 [Streptomyces albospinus]|uniref:Peptidase S1 domain-containing protein n=1 Tax=Streptomyces albospinus TaxID=285515 RepID=A0ABQ2USK3_9ACTN|nr:hypothetical protein GCM10010211_10470 [Streptomyces albospinus]